MCYKRVSNVCNVSKNEDLSSYTADMTIDKKCKWKEFLEVFVVFKSFS